VGSCRPTRCFTFTGANTLGIGLLGGILGLLGLALVLIPPRRRRGDGIGQP
jgi:hypothetical protein